MNHTDEFQRTKAKTVEQRFLHTLEQDYHYPPRIAEAILVEAQECLSGILGGVRPGQMCVLLARQGAPNGQRLSGTDMVAVILTIDDRREDQQLQRRYGNQALRQARILRLL